MIRKHSPELNAVLQDNAMLTRMMMQTQQVETDCIEWDAVAKSHSARKKIAAIAIMIVAVLMLLLPILCHAAGERELVTVLAAKVRHGIIQRGLTPDAPANIRLNNLENPGRTGTADRTEVKSLDTIAKAVSAVPDLVRELSQKTHDLAVALAEEAETERENKRLKQELAESQAKATALEESQQPPPSAAEVVGATPLIPVPEVPSLQIFTPVGAAAVQEEVYWLTVLSQESCPPCKTLWADVGEVYRIGSTTVHFEWIDVVKEPQRVPAKYRGWSFTTPLVTFESATGPRFIPWPTNRAHILSMLRKWKAIRAIPVASTAVGGSFRTGGRIRRLLNGYSSSLGQAAVSKLRVDRTGLQTLSVTKLMHGQPWTPLMAAGKFGHVAVSTTSTRLAGGLQDLGFTYKILDDGRFAIDADAITVMLPNQKPSQAVGGEACGIDPITIGWTIVSLGNALYQMLNPQVDVGLGGTVEMSISMDGPDKMILVFSECPSIHIAAWFHFDLDVQRVEITPTNVHVAFKPQPQNWIRIDSRDFSVSDE